MFTTEVTFIEDCTGGVTSYKKDNGTITSPNYPNYFGSNIRCEWQIDVSANNYITFTLADMQLNFFDATCGAITDYILVRCDYK